MLSALPYLLDYQDLLAHKSASAFLALKAFCLPELALFHLLGRLKMPGD